jgi:hypothetical protein
MATLEASPALKVGHLLGELETYVCGQSDNAQQTNALVAARCASDAQGSMRGDERHPRI